MSDSVSRPVQVATVTVKDPVASAMRFAIFLILVTVLTGVLYFVMMGVINPPAPRTAVETQALLLEDTIRQTPTSGQAWADYVKTKTSIGDYRAAWAAVERGRTSVKGDQRIYIDLAAVNLLLIEGKFKEADKLADNVVKQDNANRTAAIELLRTKGVQTPPDGIAIDLGVQARLAKARTSAALEDWKGAVKVLTEALAMTPRASDLLAMRGDAYMRLGQKGKAKLDFEQALEFTPDYAPALNGLKEAGK